MKTRRRSLILAVTAITAALLSAYLLSRRPEASVAGIYSDGELVCTIDLSDPGSRREYDIWYGGGWNVVVVDESGIKVAAASCPDGLCVGQGYLRAAPLVCLPNKLVVKWMDGGGAPYDAVVG